MYLRAIPKPDPDKVAQIIADSTQWAASDAE
jgi:hypothetical protein